MIYLDTSVVLAHLFAEDRQPPDWIWSEDLISSRLLEYETWTRVHARGLTDSHGEAAHRLLAGLSLVDLSRSVLTRALEPFPVSVRTLDALHLATATFLKDQGQAFTVATFDRRMGEGAVAVGLTLTELEEA